MAMFVLVHEPEKLGVQNKLIVFDFVQGIESSASTFTCMKVYYYFAPFLLFCAIFIIWKQDHPLKWAISDVFLPDVFANCVHANIGTLFRSEREIIFSPNCSKFAIECD